MHHFRCLWLLLVSASIASGADGWELIRFEGRDYVPLDNIARFYGFPPPPLINPDAPDTPAPAQPGETETGPVEQTPQPDAPVVAQTDAKPEADSASNAAEKQEEPPPARSRAEAMANPTTTPPKPIEAHVRELIPVAMTQRTKTVTLDNGNAQMTLAANSREAKINGVKQWLSFPPILQNGRILVSRMDLSKTIEPRLRPEKIEGMRPVRTVVIDPGHGGHDKGAGSKFGYEKDFALDVALRLKAKLERRGMRVIMTRTSDVFIPLQERPRVANNTPDSIFVSIHFNSASSNPKASGFEIFSIAPRGAPATSESTFTIRNLREEPGNASDIPSTALSASIFHAMLGNVPMEDRGLKHARFAVLRLCTKPSVLIECGFLSNKEEAALAGSPAWRQKVADSIATGIEAYKELAEERHAPKVVAYYRGQQEATDTPPPPPVTPAGVEQTPQQN